MKQVNEMHKYYYSPYKEYLTIKEIRRDRRHRRIVKYFETGFATLLYTATLISFLTIVYHIGKAL